jgi:hypothetical protein
VFDAAILTRWPGLGNGTIAVTIQSCNLLGFCQCLKCVDPHHSYTHNYWQVGEDGRVDLVCSTDIDYEG